MSKRYEMRFTGSGGQGVILASVIIAEAAVIAGKKAIQSQVYGPEARGGLCRAEAILSDGTLWYSKVEKPDFLLALTQEALDKYAPDVTDDAVIMIDSSLEAPKTTPEGVRVVQVPILATATEKVGKSMTANIVAVGAINTLLCLFDDKSLQKAVKRHIPAGTEKVNNLALREGIKLVTPEMLNAKNAAPKDAKQE